ncbi:PREDICTED: adenylate kinase isoenzyme 5 isoform X1 [Nanorana parkeri]|uniref:adenylate kinase isoenzyme 5 isoform X1 n=1 Tax=Nanorana parkeri TaxID=125878 RepID=UPI000853F891|nr:PREDICTED: adenylate kinase isoenzyme 5 isoform X1 [Nanorana parkeri]
MNSNDSKEYLTRREIPQLFEGLLNGLMYYRPDDPVDYLENCLQKVKELGGSEKVKWDTFVGPDKRNLPPLNGGQGRRAFFRNVLPESCNFPYRRYDRLPPIHQFSIESDTDLSETAELIEEYEVFDPSRPHPQIILVIGGPGSGKGTQSLKIAERYGFEYISVGELLRKKIHNTSSNRKWSLIAKIITTGELAPQETTITEIKQKLMQIPDSEGIVIDGFPRDVAQALSFEDQICTPDLVVFLACANHKLKERLLKRAEQQGRPDDNLKAIQRRLMNFKQNAVPLVNYFQEKGLIITFDADRDEEEIFDDISAAVDSKLFPAKEPVAGPSELDLSLILDSGEASGSTSAFEHQNEEIAHLFGDDYLREELKKLKVIFILGGPGSGKGIQCEKLAQKYCLTYLSIGDLLQSDLALPSERSKLIRDLLEREDPVPADIILDILKNAISSSLGATKGFVLDSFPCEIRQTEEFECKLGKPDVVLYLDCPAETMTARLVGRNKAAHRSDISTETIQRRLQMFYQMVEPILAYYESKSLLCKINAEGSPEQVFLHLCTSVDSIF